MRPCVRIGQRQLLVGLVLQPSFNLSKLLHLRSELAQFLVQTRGLEFQVSGLRSVRRVERPEIALNALFNLPHALLKLVWREVAIPIVDRLELAAIHSHAGLCQQLQMPADHHELTTGAANAFAAVPAEVGDGLEVGCQSARQPHQLDVTLALALEAAARLHSVQIAVDVDLQQHRGVIRRSTRVRGFNALKAKSLQIEFFDECIDYSHRVVFGNVVVQTFR